ncbi:tRNA (adenosine(37)-N6)-dimethylallyltransferase MiaA [Roseobacter weihaiensis]|uniref:tRNA (adenosine(37)-N6)-dimethylallyltransferase MiaA n=1 Tax=Roseobacter weihaiensis TaxID=2763262 RepID=UPI001D0AF493|nr:tRNA (adenosine(37)-N6)-dimethylallyltransferase MiaA [Roseobacter sp. H9]
MTPPQQLTQDRLLEVLVPDKPVLIAGPTASGKSELALRIAEAQGGVIVNADASQVYDCWQVVTARPSQADQTRAPHALYGHLRATDAYSAGHWLREVTPFVQGPQRPIIVGGTGLYFQALTRGLADIPATPPALRAEADALPLEVLLADLDARTHSGIDTANRARVQRAWEVLRATGRGLADWQAETGAALMPLGAAQGIVFEVSKDWLNNRIAQRFDLMLAGGALEEARAVLSQYNPALPAHRAIGAPELIAHLRGDISLEQARAAAVVATRQFAKRQRTWFRSKMRDWLPISPE